MTLYLDSSALVKLVQREGESNALRGFLHRRRDDHRVTSALARVEVVRAVLPGGPRAVAQARRQLARVDQVVLTSELLDRAASLVPTLRIRSLDAIHLASAQLVGSALQTIVTYDRRMADASRALGFAVEAPT